MAFALLLNNAFPWHDFITGEQDKPVLENVREMLSVRCGQDKLYSCVTWGQAGFAEAGFGAIVAYLTLDAPCEPSDESRAVWARG